MMMKLAVPLSATTISSSSLNQKFLKVEYAFSKCLLQQKKMKLHSNTHAVISNQIGREEIYYRCCVFFLPLAALYGAQVRGGDDGSSFIIHGKIALFITEERGV